MSSSREAVRKILLIFAPIMVIIACALPLTPTPHIAEEATEILPPTATETLTLPPFNYDYERQPIEVRGTTFLSSPSCATRLPSITDLEPHPAPPLQEPARGVPFYDPVFGTCIVRVTDRSKDIAADDTSRGLKNEYSRVQSFNADGSLLVIRGIDATWYLYDPNTLRPLYKLPIDVEPRWDAKDPNTLYYISETRLMSFNILTGQQTLLHEFASDFPGSNLATVWTRYEGSPTIDSRYWGLMAQNSQWETIALLIFDLEQNRVISRLNLPQKPSIDSVTISPLGNYLLAYYENHCKYGQLGTMDTPCGLMVYNQSLTEARGMLRIIGHSDAALNRAGKEVLVFQNIDTDHIAVLDLQSGRVDDLLPIDFSHTALGFHFSGRGFQSPGWAIISTYNGGHPEPFTWMDNSVFALELETAGRIVRLAHTRSIYSESIEKDYWAEPQASTNQNMSRILFTSNWGRPGSEEVETYMIQMPPLWTSLMP